HVRWRRAQPFAHRLERGADLSALAVHFIKHARTDLPAKQRPASGSAARKRGCSPVCSTTGAYFMGASLRILVASATAGEGGRWPWSFPAVSDLPTRRPTLRLMRLIPTGLLAVMVIVFLFARRYEDAHPLMGYVRAFSEAATIGALADWFAVTALF